MHMLRENNNTGNTCAASSPNDSSSPIEMDSSMNSNASNGVKPKTPLKKEELEKIAKQLKNKLSKATIAAKQSLSPANVRVGAVPSSSPLKNYYSSKNYESGAHGGMLSSSPTHLYSPNGKSPMQMRTLATTYLSSSPLKRRASEASDIADSPTKKKDTKETKSSPDNQPQMVLQAVDATPLTPPKNVATLKPSPSLTTTKHQASPSLRRRRRSSVASNVLLKTPTQPRPNTSGEYQDEEGADLLMYLASSPSPAKPYLSNTPRSKTEFHEPAITHDPHPPASAPSTSISHKAPSFIVPAPPLTPKRHTVSSAKTPQSRLTPSVNLFNSSAVTSSGLPSSGLTLTPAGFNMNDYVNFFTPSPGSANISSNNNNLGKAFLKTPDINTIITSNKQRVDGKMINFDKVGLFGGNNNDATKE